MSDLSDISLQRVRNLDDRELWERTAREAHHAWHVAEVTREEIRMLREDLNKALHTLSLIADRLGVVEARREVLDRFALAEVQDREIDLQIRRQRWDLFRSFWRRSVEWLFVGGGGAVLYALLRYLLG